MLCMSSIIYLFVVCLCRPVDDVAFVYLSSAEPMLLDLVVTGGSSFFGVLSPPRLLGRVATVYVVPSHNEGGAKGTTGILPSSLCLSEQVTMLWEGG